MRISSTLLTSFRAIRHRLRGALATAAILGVGLSSLALTGSIVREISVEIDSIANGISAQSLTVTANAGTVHLFPPLQADLSQSIREASTSILFVIAWRMGSVNVLAQGRGADLLLYGVAGDYELESSSNYVEGVGIGLDETESMNRVCVVGAYVPTILGFENASSAVGEEIFINGMPCTIVGVFGLGKTISAARFDRAIITPLRSANQYFFDHNEEAGREDVDWFTVVFDEVGIDLDQASVDIDRTVRSEMGIAQSQHSAISFADPATPRRLIIRQRALFASLLLATSTIAFVACIIGYAATLHNYFSARVREFGIRQAIGATTGDILMQTSIEATTIGFLGGMLGGVLGYLLVFTIANVTNWSMPVDVFLMAFTIGVGLLIGIVIGIPSVLAIVRRAPAAAAKVIA